MRRTHTRRRFLRESKEVTVLICEPSEQPFEALEGWDLNDSHLHDDSRFYAFDAEYATLSEKGKVYKPDSLNFNRSSEVCGLVEKGRELVAVKFDPDNRKMVGCLAIDGRSSWNIAEELVSLNDYINGRGIYDVYMFEDVPEDVLKDINLRYAYDELRDMGYEGGFERSEYVPTDVPGKDVPDNIDWSSYDFSGNYVVIYNGKIVR